METRIYDEDRTLILSSSFELEEYLSSAVLLWRVKVTIPPLTPGNLMLAMKRTSLDSDNDMELIQAIEHVRAIIDQRKVAWEKKIRTELPMRLQQWRSVVEEILEYGAIDRSYQYNVRVRVILTLLMDAMRFPDVKLSEKLLRIDENLSQIAVNDGFVWNRELEASFPREHFAFLYLR